jgi:predicted O-methyltransferase YrrM
MLNKPFRNTFDLIYVDGCHKLLDSYTDILLCHFLLNKNGLLIIDDVDYNKSNLMESPLKGVEYFLQKFETSYKILSSGYRLFLEKIN